VSWWERVAILAPVIVVAAGAAAGLVVLWTKVGWEALKRQSHPWRIVAVGVAALCLLFALSLLGIKLPRE
jgi:thiol:disulfide interchange protein